MDFDEFTGEIQHRLELAGTGEAVRATRATLSTLGQRIQAGEATDLAAPLPMEIGRYLTGPVEEHGERFDFSEFVTRVADIEGIEESEAAYHAQVVVDLASTVAASSDIRQVRDQLPGDENWEQLFELIEEGGWSEDRGSAGNE